MPVAVVFLLRAVVLVMLWGFVIAAVVAVRHDVFGTRASSAPAPAAAPGPVAPARVAGAPPAAVVPVPATPGAHAASAGAGAAGAAAGVAAPSRRNRPPAPPARPRRKLPPAPATRLVVVEGPSVGAHVALSSLPITIGRADDSTLVLADDYASQHHARLIPQGTDWLIEDTRSTNGTFIGETRVTGPVVVAVGGRFRIGSNILEVQA